MKTHVFESVELTQALCTELLKLSQSPSPVHIALSGGSTPKAWFQVLAQENWLNQIKWENLHFWWGDERHVPLSDSQSNAGEALRLVLAQTKAKIHVLRTELNAPSACSVMENELKQLPQKSGLPVFDWMILGIGEDGHTASLFPHQNYPQGSCHLASHPQSGQVRVSLSMAALQNAKRISFLCTGAAKKPILAAMQSNDEIAMAWPAHQLYQLRPDAEFWLDAAAQP